MSACSDTLEWEEFPLFAPCGAHVPKLSEEGAAERVSPALGALSHLLYDDETPQEASELLRDEGNRHFKQGKRGYKNAIFKYNEAIRAARDVQEALAPAYLNRAMAEYKLGNYGRALQDVEKSLELTSGNVKAHYRAALCATHLEKFDVALRHCDEGVNTSASDSNDAKVFQKQRAIVETLVEKQCATEEARTAREAAAAAEDASVASMLKERGVTLGAPLFGQQRRYSVTQPVRLGSWHWPLLLVYPGELAGGAEQSDYIENVPEDATMRDVLASVFNDGVPRLKWDAAGMYSRADKLEMRFRRGWTLPVDEIDPEYEILGSELPSHELGDWVSLREDMTLRNLVARKNYITPLFPVLYVVPRGVTLR